MLAVLADNDELLQEKNAVCSTQQDGTNRTTLAAEDQVLRCLGAALIMQWKKKKKKGKAQIARFLHTHKNDESSGGDKE